jgi:hypothetical protein
MCWGVGEHFSREASTPSWTPAGVFAKPRARTARTGSPAPHWQSLKAIFSPIFVYFACTILKAGANYAYME